MKKSLFALMAAWLIVAPAMACLNGFEELFSYKFELSRAKFPVPMGHGIKIGDRYQTEIEDAKRGYEGGRFENSVDYGLFLVYQEKYEEAEVVFRKVAQRWPEKYESASNLGTILEVNGSNEEALKWIKKAIAIDPKSHDGSEWIHVKILEAKLKGGEASGSSMTGVDFGESDAPATNKHANELKRLQKQLFYQLNERITFIQPKDPYIAALMMELGNVTLALDQRKAAKDIYAIAKKYGLEDPLLERRVAHAGKPAPTVPATADTFSTVDTLAEVAAADTQPVVAATDSAPRQLAVSTAPATIPNSYGNFAVVAAIVAAVGLGIALLFRVLRKQR